MTENNSTYNKTNFLLYTGKEGEVKTVFGKDYFEELLERIREIRASERRFYQKITDIYARLFGILCDEEKLLM